MLKYDFIIIIGLYKKWLHYLQDNYNITGIYIFNNLRYIYITTYIY